MKMSSWIVCFATVWLFAATVQAASWRGVQDSSGCTWARVLVVNNSETDSNWAIWNCRTAVSSSADSAETDALADWDGVANAGSAEYVWVYGFDIGEINLSNADGGASALTESATLDAAGDGELVITIAEDGAASIEIVVAETYSAPSQAGSMPADE